MPDAPDLMVVGSPPDRVIADLGEACAGPTLVVTVGIHGNEPAGDVAAGRVVAQMNRCHHRLRGRLVILRGNLPALHQRVRYLRRDLNRRWEAHELERLALCPDELQAEDRQQHELAACIRGLERGSQTPLVFLDLHTTSAKTVPFVCTADALRNRPLALALGLPVLLGLEEVIDATMLGYVVDQGHCGISVEGGRHDDPSAIEIHECVLWKSVVELGLLEVDDVPELETYSTRLRHAARGTPSVLEVRHRHVVGDDDHFVMAPGYASFQPIRAGELLAHDRNGPIRAPETGLLLMPRYQPQGEDGFFIARAVAPLWLKLSAWLRRRQAERLLPLLPGVRRDPDHHDRLVVDPSVARLRTTDLMHLFGYRRVHARGERLLFSRRRADSVG